MLTGWRWLGWLGILAIPGLVQADGGTLRFSRLCGGYRVTLFTAPTVLRAGLVDFSVLVQSAASAQPRLDVPVTIQVYPQGEPHLCRGDEPTTARATNRLLRALSLELNQPGTWVVEVTAGPPPRAVTLATELTIEPPLPSWLELAPWIGWPFGALVLFAIHQRLVQVRQFRGQTR